MNGHRMNVYAGHRCRQPVERLFRLQPGTVRSADEVVHCLGNKRAGAARRVENTLSEWIID